MYDNKPTKCLTGRVRLSYCHLTEPNNNYGGEPKYSVTLLIPKSDTATKADIDAAMAAAADNGVKGCWNGARPTVFQNALIYDGDGVRPSGEKFGKECRGHWVITASSKTKPDVVHISNIRSQLLPTDIYSGMYARVTINFYPYNYHGNKGIGCGLGNVVKVDEGKPLGGRCSAASDFAGLENAASQQYQPPAYAAPTQQYRQSAALDPITGQPITGTYGF
ncbi:MAG: DUF2815 family protein [bacterium]|nr:DUF2815 family protein [bacterium]